MNVTSTDAGRRTPTVLLGLGVATSVVLGSVLGLLPLPPTVTLAGPALLGGLLVIAAAALAPVGAGQRGAVVVLVVLEVLAATALASFTMLAAAGRVALLVLTVVLPFAAAARSWLGQSLAAGLHGHLDRAWRTNLRLTLALAGAQVVMNVANGLTFGAVFRASGPVGIVASAAVAGALGGLAVHLVVTAWRTVRVLDGGDPGPPRPVVLAVGLAAAALFSAALTTSAVLGVG